MLKSISVLLTSLVLAPLAALHAADDLPEPPVSWKYPPEMPGASVEVYREVNGVKLNAYIFTPPNHRALDHRPAVLFFLWRWMERRIARAIPAAVTLPRAARHGRDSV
jgi:hypothetical protein